MILKHPLLNIIIDYFFNKKKKKMVFIESLRQSTNKIKMFNF